MTAPNTSPIASDAACRAGFPYSWMCRSMFSMTTIASSTTMPVARMMPKSVSVLIEKPSSLTNANVPMSDTGIVIVGMSVAAPALEEQEHHEHDERDRLGERLEHFADRLARRPVVVLKAIWYFRPGGKLCRQPLELRATRRVRRRARWRSAAAITPKPTASIALEPQLRRVGLGAELGAADVLQPDERAVRARS